MTKRRILFLILLIVGVFALAGGALIQPSHDRMWIPEHERMPTALVTNGSSLTITNLRAFRHTTATSSAHWETRELDLDELERLDYIVVPFAGFGAAHTMLSFGFADGQHISVSIEARRERGESFSPLWGTLKQFELLYIIADERDLLSQRAVRRGNEHVYLYPVATDHETIRRLFVDILGRANNLVKEPEFYNTVYSTCTTNLMHHVNAVAPGSVPWWDLRLYLPRYSDTLAQKLNFIPNDVSIDTLRETHNVAGAIQEHADAPRFSELIRADLP
ncbi:MAG: DUF4105 domain-containing protein [Candidatus Paceibacterota bacterium]